MKTRLSLLMVLAVLVGLLFNPGVSHAQTSVSGTLVAWGYSGYGQADVPVALSSVTAVDGGYYYSLALKNDGTVFAWGDNGLEQSSVPAGLSNVTAIAAGNAHNLALKNDGTVFAWGYNGQYQTNVPIGLSGVTAISAGGGHSLALKADGNVVAWGQNVFGQRNVPGDLTGVIAISAGGVQSLALKSDGTVVAWGDDQIGYTDGNVPAPTGLSGVIAIAAGGRHSLALKSDGTVVAWGNNWAGQTDVPAGLTGVIAIDAGYDHSLALKSDGTVVGWGYNGYGQTSVPADLSGVTSIAAGGYHSLALIPQGNTAPIANHNGPYLVAVNTVIPFDGSFSYDPENDPLSFAWDFGDNTSGTGVTPTHSYMVAGIYDVCLTVNDGTVVSAPTCTLAVVYDPSAGFVTGGGWIASPAGAYKADEALAGKATFGFVSKYQKGASVPTGRTAFEFDLAGLAFSSQCYEWLVVNQASSNAQFKGTGLISGTADPNGNAYKFMLWAEDGAPDTFRIRIWWDDAAGEHDVYDNGVTQPIGAGNIVVHMKK